MVLYYGLLVWKVLIEIVQTCVMKMGYVRVHVLSWAWIC